MTKILTTETIESDAARCYLRGTSVLGLFNTVVGCIVNRVLVRVSDADTKKTVAWRWDRATDHPPEHVEQDEQCKCSETKDETHALLNTQAERINELDEQYRVLLEASIQILDSIENYNSERIPEEDWDEYDYMMFPRWAALRAAIAKARGGGEY